MAYGAGKRLGETIDPRLMMADFSGVERAGQAIGQSFANVGAQIGAIKKEQKKVDAYNKSASKAIESAITLGKEYNIAGVEKTLRPFLDSYNDPSLSPIEKAALLDEGKAMISNVFNRFDASESSAIKTAQIEAAENEAKAKAAAAGREAPSLAEFGVQGGTQKLQWNPDTKSYELPKVNLGGANPPQQGIDLTELVKSFEGFNPNAYNDYKQTSIGFGTRGKPGEIITEEEASNRLQAELTGHAERIRKAAEMKGVSLNENQFKALTSFDYNTGRGANLIERFGNQPDQLAAKMLEYTKAGGKDLPGLVERRQIEAALFLSPTQQAASPQQFSTASQSRIGFVPSKNEEKETFRPATKEESELYGGVPGQMSSSGKFIPINLPSGFSIEQTPEGGLKVIQGPGAGGKEKAQKEAAEAYKMGNATALSQELNLLEDTTKDMVPGVAGSVARAVGQEIPGTELASRKKIIDRVVSTLTLQGLQNMRNSSPTGASLGNISNMDVGLLRDSATALSNIQDPEAFKRELVRLQNLQHNIIYGSEQVLRDKLKKKEITQDQFDEAMAAAPKSFINERGAVVTRQSESKPKIGLSPEGQSAREAIRNQ